MAVGNCWHRRPNRWQACLATHGIAPHCTISYFATKRLQPHWIMRALCGTPRSQPKPAKADVVLAPITPQACMHACQKRIVHAHGPSSELEGREVKVSDEVHRTTSICDLLGARTK